MHNRADRVPRPLPDRSLAHICARPRRFATDSPPGIILYPFWGTRVRASPEADYRICIFIKREPPAVPTDFLNDALSELFTAASAPRALKSLLFGEVYM